MRSPVKKATCRTFLCALAFASLASGQVVEKARTWADLQASHPCSSGLSGRITRLLDADSASDIGGGGGSTQVWVQCDGVDTWSIVSIGGGAGGGLSDSDYGDVAVSGSGTAMTVEALRGGAVAVAATTGNLQWEGTTADAFEGNFTFADPTVDWTWAWDATGDVTGGTSFRFGGATSSFPMLKRNSGNLQIRLADDSAYALALTGGVDVYADATSRVIALYGASPYTVIGGASGVPIGWSSSATDGGTLDTSMTRKAAGTVNLSNAFGSTPTAAPPHACDAGAEGEFYSDTSHAACWCDGTTWTKLSGAGTCA